MKKYLDLPDTYNDVSMGIQAIIMDTCGKYSLESPLNHPYIALSNSSFSYVSRQAREEEKMNKSEMYAYAYRDPPGTLNLLLYGPLTVGT